jgi:hypothetical protein
LQTKNDLKQIVAFYGFVTNCTDDCKKKKIQFYQVSYVVIAVFPLKSSVCREVRMGRCFELQLAHGGHRVTSCPVERESRCGHKHLLIPGGGYRFSAQLRWKKLETMAVNNQQP